MYVPSEWANLVNKVYPQIVQIINGEAPANTSHGLRKSKDLFHLNSYVNFRLEVLCVPPEYVDYKPQTLGSSSATLSSMIAPRTLVPRSTVPTVSTCVAQQWKKSSKASSPPLKTSRIYVSIKYYNRKDARR